MNTNSNLYTVIYTTLIVVVVAAVLAFVSQSLKSKQEANEKADTISQMMTAAQFGTKAEFQKMGNKAVLEKYAAEIEKAYTVGMDGEKIADLPLDKVFSPSELKRQNYNIKGGQNATGEAELPVFVFKDGTTVVPVYGAGLWGPVWGYIAFEKGSNVIKGAYFDHESETAGLGAKIKDDPTFQAEFVGESAAFGGDKVFAIVKGGSPKNTDGSEILDNQIDAITGATMTSQGLETAVNTWLAAYAKHFEAACINESCNHEACNHEACGHEACKQESCNHENCNHESCNHESCSHEACGQESCGQESCNHEACDHADGQANPQKVEE